MMNWDAKVGEIKWDGCKKCKHTNPVKGGCKVDVSDRDLWVEDGYVYCRLFEREG